MEESLEGSDEYSPSKESTSSEGGYNSEELFDEVEVKPSKEKESKKMTTQEALSRIVSEEKTGKKRKPKVCPVEGCGTTVVYLPRHLRQIHKWKKERAVHAVQMFGLRTSQQQQQHHLKKFHKITKADAAYRELLLKARQTHPKKANDSENLKQNSVSFEGWLQSVDGGMKSTKSARQHRTQVQTVVSVIDPQKLLPNSLLNKVKFREDFLTQYTANKKFLPGTIKSYLCSVRHYLHFQIYSGSPLEKELRDMIDTVGRWVASYRKEGNKRALEKGDRDMSKLITPEMVKTFKESKATKEAVTVLHSLKAQVSQTEFVLVRDMIMTSVLLTNANRSGVLANMLLDQVQNIWRMEGVAIISVTEHKTASYLGPAKVVLSEEVYGWLCKYITVRAQVERGDTVEVFVSWTGQKMESSQICKAVQSSWRKAGLDGEITSTLMRKSAVSKIHETHPAMKSQLSDLMCHRVETATKSYRLVERERTSVAAAEVLRDLMAFDTESAGPSTGPSTSDLKPTTARGKRIFSSTDLKVS
ncbi:hypothetical protein SKAU_G00413700 [Synaphobranchus kaupii]|uniref:Tyr recombinase domain-containing protein n=1 Tax=Synaphobranchus kaupii TaxID=118154 RepID=A0A9Q1IC02_SYNKA|nr:hypothetical protein SKAU_G00413700 [Synaphobranchus kaupii]